MTGVTVHENIGQKRKLPSEYKTKNKRQGSGRKIALKTVIDSAIMKKRDMVHMCILTLQHA